MIIVSSSGRSNNGSKSSSNSRSSNCSSAVAAVVEVTSRNCSISSSSNSSSRSCNSIVLVSVFLRFLSYKKKIVIVMAVIIAKIYLRMFSECPKTSDHNSNATPFKELQCFDALS